MFQYTLIENGKIGCTPADVNDCNSGFQIFLSHDRCCGCQWLQNKIFRAESAFFYCAIYIPYGIFIPGNDVKICTHFHSAISDWIGYILEIINSEFLWNNINDLVPG